MTRIDDRFPIIASRNDPRIKRIRNLHLREERDRSGLFLMEGTRFVFQAIQHRVPIETLVVAPALLASPVAQKMVRQQRRAGAHTLEVTPELFHSLSLAEEPQGVAAVVRQRWEPLERAQPAEGLCWVALDTVHSPGNLGALLRTCDAVGAAGLILVSDATDPFHPAAVRASMGAIFSQRFVRATPAALFDWKRRHQCRLIGTSPAGRADYRAVAYRSPTVLFMGSERRGLPPEYQALCDTVVRIPMVGSADSLNLAIATSVLLYEIFHQRRAESDG